eukprot:2931218-Pleurochrysis_carterae.AAC.1
MTAKVCTHAPTHYSASPHAGHNSGPSARAELFVAKARYSLCASPAKGVFMCERGFCSKFV